MNKLNKKGFTLVEVLVVIAILALIIIIVATNGFGAFDKTKKKIEQEKVKAVEESIKTVLLDVENCDDDTQDYNDLKEIFNMTETITSCKNLKENLNDKEINVSKLKEKEYIKEKDIELIEDVSFSILVNDEDENKFDIFHMDESEAKVDIGTDIKETTYCGKKIIGNEEMLYGDINFDMAITDIDATLSLSLTVGNVPKTNNFQLIVADVDGDGNAIINDSLKIQNYISNPDIKIAKIGQSVEGLIFSNKCGDANYDDKVDELDYIYIYDYLFFTEGYFLHPIQVKGLDINGDGKLNVLDSKALKKHINESFKASYCGSGSFGVESYGDVNFDDEVDYKDVNLIKSLIEGKVELNPIHLTVGDVNQDGKLDLLDYEIIKKYVDEIFDDSTKIIDKPVQNLTFSNVCGDINNDGKVDAADYALLEKEVSDVNEYYLSNTEKKYADIDGDSKVNADDLVLFDFLIN